MFVVAVRRFTESPIFGGGEAAALQVRVRIPDYPQDRWMTLHTHYLIVLVAYGVTGMIGLLMLVTSFVRFRTSRIAEVAALTVLLFGTMTFISHLLPWYALLGCPGRFSPSTGKERGPAAEHRAVQLQAG